MLPPDPPPRLVRPISALLALGAAFLPATPLPAWLLLELAQLGLPDDVHLDDALNWLGQQGLMVPGPDDTRVIGHEVTELASVWLPGSEITLLVAELVAADMAGRLLESDSWDLPFDARLLPHAQHIADAALARSAPIAPALAAALGQQLMEQAQLEVAGHYLRRALQAYAQQGTPPGEESIVAATLAHLGAMAQLTGDRRGAASYLARALRRYEAAFGPEHLHTRAAALALWAVRDIPRQFGLE